MVFFPCNHKSEANPNKSRSRFKMRMSPWKKIQAVLYVVSLTWCGEKSASWSLSTQPHKQPHVGELKQMLLTHWLIMSHWLNFSSVFFVPTERNDQTEQEERREIKQRLNRKVIFIFILANTCTKEALWLVLYLNFQLHLFCYLYVCI